MSAPTLHPDRRVFDGCVYRGVTGERALLNAEERIAARDGREARER
jgi:hypothetical protein